MIFHFFHSWKYWRNREGLIAYRECQKCYRSKKQKLIDGQWKTVRLW